METITLELQQHSETAMKLQNDQFDLLVDRPVAKGGGGSGLMGGQYMLLGIGGCFCSTFFAAAQSRGFSIEGLLVKVNATISDDLPKRFTDVKLEVSYDRCSDPSSFDKLLKIAEQGCISVNTVKNGLNFSAIAG
ncbi:OsmC family protein [Ekhidna sp.]